MGRALEPEAVGVGLVALHAVRAGDDIAVGVALAHALQEALPHAAVARAAVHPLLVLPAGLGGDDGDVLRVGRPDVEPRALHALRLARVRAQLAVDLVVRALVKQEAVIVGKDGAALRVFCHGYLLPFVASPCCSGASIIALWAGTVRRSIPSDTAPAGTSVVS